MKKRLLSMILALSMMLTILPVNAITAWAENGKIIQSGNCGNNVTYDLTQNNDDTTNPTYTLTIKGNGEMADFKESDMEGRAPWIAQKEKITAVTIENGVTYVGAYAFDHCKKLTQITIHAQLNSIGKGAFRDCEGLTSIEIPKTVTSIGASAFSRCKGLSNIEIPETVVSIGGAAFNGCTGLTSIKIPATVTSIEEYTFNECSNLKNVEIPQGVVSIGECAFSECGILESIEIPQNVTSIGENAFFGCKTLTSIKIPAKVTSISKGILSGCSNLKDVEILGAVTSIGDNAFMSCGQLTDIKIPDTVTSIGKNAFYMSGLTSIKIPNTVTSIGEYAFYVCNSLAKIEMPANMPSISQYTFYRTTTTVDETRVFYYPGYRHDWDQQVSKISANGNTDLLANDYERVHYYCDVIFDSNGGTFTDGSNTKTIKEVWRKEHLTQEQINSVGKPTKDGKMFIGWNTTQDATTVIDPKSDYIADGKIYYAVYKDAVPAAVTIDDLDGTTVKAGEAKEFTVSVTPNDDANTGAKATITVSGANADAVEKIQYKDGETWKDVPGEGLSIDEINNTKFKLITKADANDGDVTITVTANKANGTEIDKKVAAVTVKKHENAAVTITDLDGTTVKAGEAKEFTVSVTPNDDANTGAKATITVSGANADAVEKIQYKDGETWKDVPGEGLSIDEINNTKFKLITKADANDGDVTITVTANKANGTEIDKKVAAVTVKKHENAAVTIDGLDTDLKQGESKNFTVTVDPKDDSGDATIDFGNKNSEIQYKDGEDWKSMPSDGLKIDLNNGKKPYDFRITPKNDGENQKLTATVKKENTKLGEAEKSYNVSKYVDAVVKIDGLSGTVETDTEKEFTVTVTANDDAGKNVTAKAGFTGPAGATITLKKVQYRFGDSGEWQDGMQELNGMNLDINSLELPFNSLPNITYKLTVTFAEAGNYEFDVSLTKAAAAEAFTSDRAEVTVTKKEEPVTPGGGSTGGGEKPGENPGSGSTGGGENPGENPGSGSTGGSENPGENPGGNPGSGSTKPEQETPKRKLEIADGTLTSVTVKDKNGNLKDITDTITKDLDGKYEIPVGAKVTITAKDAPEGMKFGEWSISDKTLLSDPDVPYTEKDLIFTMPDNPDGVKLSVVYLEESIGEEPNLVEKGALAGTVVVGSAALLYQGHMLGTELYLRYLLPHGAVIPQNRAELAVLLWQDAENPEPVSTTLYSDISDEDSAIQQAARWAVENDLMEQLDAEEHPDHFDPFVPVTFSDSIRAWKKAQELKKSVH